MIRNLLALFVSFLALFLNAQSQTRLNLVSANPNVFTNQDYSPWLSDDLNDLVQGTWGNNDPNNRYVDVYVKLAKRSIISKISLYDHQGQFPPDHLASIYVVNGSDSTFVGTFDGAAYLTFIDYPVNNVTADAIVIRKFGNDIPQKVRAYGTELAEPSSNRLSIVSAIPDVYTNQDYSPWLSDDLNDLVQGTYGNNDPNNRYVDVNLKLAGKSYITKVSLYDYQGQFPTDHLTYIYLVNGMDSTFVGTFDGSSYLTFIDYPVNSVLAEAIVIRKYGNDLPQKVRAYGYEGQNQDLITSVIDFPSLAPKLTNDPPFQLLANSNNRQQPITFSSSDTSIVSLALTAGNWIATIHKAGLVTFTATQQGNASYTAATPVERTLVITAPPIINPTDTVSRIPIAAIIPNHFTGQDYSPWLNDNLDSLVQGTYGNNDPNNRYVDVAVWLAKRTLVTKVSLYDYY